MRNTFLLLLLFTFNCYTVFSQSSKPNIIFILADDLGYGDLEVYGQDFIETPNLNQLSENGVTFTEHYAGSTVCAPSRASLLTGMHTGHSPIRGNHEKFPQGQFPLPDSTVTIAQLLQENGYHTNVIGKWGLGFPSSSGIPSLQGFDNFFGYNCQRKAHGYYPRKLWDNLDITKEYKGEYSHSVFTDKALEYIEEKSKEPFFLYLAYTIPHAKLQIPKEKTTHYIDKIKTDSTLSKLGPLKKKHTIKYASMVSLMDEDIGRIVHKLDSLNLLENTIIIFSSDNGPHSERGYNPKILNSSGGLRGKKRDLYEGGIKIPHIVSWKGTVEAGQVSNHVSAHWDFFPTVTDILDIPNPKGIDGISYLPTLLNSGDQKKHEYLYWEFHGKRGRQAVLSDQWKLIKYKVNSSHPQLELYNLSSDPSESKNVILENMQMVEKLKKMMNSAHSGNRVFKFKFDK
ncbi:MAG TPA: arylsulfatase [Chitinophagales bacterium]|nr:arylsulfatase [Chitinophagales bacterium]